MDMYLYTSISAALCRQLEQNASLNTVALLSHYSPRQRTPKKTQEEPANQSKSLTDSDASDDNEVNPRFKTSVKERQYNTIPGSVTATHVAHSHSRAQANPTLEQGPPQCKVKVKKPSTDKTKDKHSDAEHKGK